MIRVIVMVMCMTAAGARAKPISTGQTQAPAATAPTVATAAAAAVRGTFTLPDSKKMIEAYGAFVAKRPSISAAQKQAVARRVADAVAHPEKREGLIVGTLQMLYGDFSKAMDLLANEKDKQAIALLGELVKSDDAYLAANARFFLARARVNAEQYEQALPLLEPLVGRDRDKTQYAGQAMFLRGVCQAGLLQRKQAIESFRQFIKADSDAPERLVVGALHQLDKLQQLSDGSLPDVEERMDYSRRKLELEDAGRQTQTQQKRVVSILDALIKKAEKKEKGGSGGGGGSGESQGNGGGGGTAGGASGGATQSTAPAGEAHIGALHRTTRGDANEQWGKQRQRQRDAVLNAIKARYPERYRQLVEQYYRALQEEKP